MNFFEHQDQSRRQTRWLVFLFILAVLAIIAVVDLVLLVAFGLVGESGQELLNGTGLQSNLGLIAGGAAATASVIGLASLGKTLSLRSGGGHVARELGGTLVEPNSRDPLKRRLYNIVEEISLASGVPLPEVYVLENEAGINAFAAGYSPSDAAVAVTRGAMEKLSRSELQGVIAHEFSHVLNGDMRLNIRLMGALFGILLLAIIGRRVLFHSHYVGRSRDNSGVAIVVLALALTAVGYIGLFFGRWIKAAVSRQREYLADASAVQFTREPDGIAGALKKIAVYSEHSWLDVDSEEVGHMLFGEGQKMHMMATHPPIVDRIRRIEPYFSEDELKTVAKRIQRDEERVTERAKRAAEETTESRPGFLDPASIMENIGNPDLQQLLLAAAVSESLPDPVRTAAHVADRAPESLLYSLLHDDPAVREAQLLAVAEAMGAEMESSVRHLAHAAGPLPGPQCWPLLEILMPGLRRQTPECLRTLILAADGMVRADGRVDVFEFLVMRLMKRYLWEVANPHLADPSGKKSIRQCRKEAADVLAILALHGHPDEPDAAGTAFAAGMTELTGDKGLAMPQVVPWMPALDHALDQLDQLSLDAKQKLVKAMIITVNSDGQWVPSEVEMLRAICAALHVPLPILSNYSA